MADTISPDELVGALTSAFSKYSSEIRDKIDSRVEEIGNEAVEEVKSLSPVYAGKNKKLIDKNAKIGNNCKIGVSGKKYEDGDHGSFYSADGIIVIRKNAVIPSGTEI